MKRKAAILLCILLALGLSACWNKGITRDQLEEVVLQNFNLAPEDSATITYAGEFSDGEDVLVWFIIQKNAFTYYRAIDCRTVSEDRYEVKDILFPKIYAEDIASLLWKTELLFLINSPECRRIVVDDKKGNILYEIQLSEDDLPYLYQIVSFGQRSRTSFLDAQGKALF